MATRKRATKPTHTSGALGLAPPRDPSADVRVYSSGRGVTVLWTLTPRARKWWTRSAVAESGEAPEGADMFGGGYSLAADAVAPILEGLRVAGLTVTQ
jgi:hypothetical protein